MMKSKSKKIVFTGGGTAGHVMPNIALIEGLESHNVEAVYIGSSGIEREIMSDRVGRYHVIPVGKLRRYISFENLVDVFRVVAGILKSMLILLREKPMAVMSKGGYVSVPVVFAAYVLNIPVYCHESDLSPGLATKLGIRVARKVFYTFPESQSFFSNVESECVGSLIRPEIFKGKPNVAKEYLGLESAEDLPVLLVVGGSLGAECINKSIQQHIEELTKMFFIVHVTGRGKTLGIKHKHYRAVEFLKEEMKDVLALSDFVLARAGANSIFEFLGLNLPMLLVPLEKGSRGDQVENAQIFEKNGWSMTLRDSQIGEQLLGSMRELVSRKSEIKIRQMEYVGVKGGVKHVVDQLLSAR